MPVLDRDDLILVRHAPARHGGRLVGRTDVAADLSDGGRLSALAAWIGADARWIASPARRCRQTAEALSGAEVPVDPRLWEQDFGAFDGVAFADLPDLGPLSADELAQHRWPSGESFGDMVDRAAPALGEIADGAGPAVVVAHAGTVRAGLALAMGATASALAFEVDPLSVTRLRIRDGAVSVRAVNLSAP